MVGRLLVGFVWLNLLFSVSWQVDFQWDSCGHSLVFCVMVGRLLLGFVWLNLQSSVSWQVDIQWVSCGSIFRFLCHGWQTFSGVRVAQSFVFFVKVGNFQWGSCGSIFSFLCHGWQTFRGVRVAQSLVFCVMVRILLVGFVCLNLQFSASWLEDFQCGSCGSNISFLCHGRQTFSGVRVAQSFVFCVMVGRLLVGFERLSLQFSGSRQATFSGVRVAQSLLFCLMVGRLLVGSCGSIICFLCHDWWTFIGVRVAQSFVFCVMVGRLLVGFVCLNLQISVSWLVDFQWGSCGSIFSFGSWQVDVQWGSCGSIFTFLSHGWQTFSGLRLAQSLVFCVMVRILLVGFVCLNLQFSESWQVDFQWGSCGSIFSFLRHGWQTFSGVRDAQSLVFWVKVGDFQWGSCGSIFTFLSHGWQNFSGVRVAQSFVFCVMVGRLLVGFVCLNLLFSVSLLVNLQWASCVSIFRFLCQGWYTFSGVRVAQSFVFCVMVGRILVGLAWLNLQFSVSWQVDFQWGSCGSIFSFLCHGRQTFSVVRVA